MGPVAHSRQCDGELPALLSWRGDDGSSEIRRDLTAAERGALKTHEAALEHSLAPIGDANTAAALASIQAMFAGFRSMRQQGDDAEAVSLVTLAVLGREFPEWAIHQACERIASGRAIGQDVRFAPNDSELAAIARTIVRKSRERLDTTQRLLGATVMQPKPRPTYEELKAKCAEAGLEIGPKKPRMLATEIAKFRAENGISDADWNAIPNAK